VRRPVVGLVGNHSKLEGKIVFSSTKCLVLSTVVCFALIQGPAGAQSPTSLAENSHEHYAYCYTYNAKYISGPLAQQISESSESTDADVLLAVETLLRSEEAFQYFYNALTQNDDSQWYWAWTRIVLAKQAANELFQSTGNNTAKSVAWTWEWPRIAR